MPWQRLIQETLAANLALPEQKLVTFTWGNVSSCDRKEGLVAIKPSGVPYDKLEARHIVVVDLNGKVIHGTYRPSSDLLTHLELYKAFPEAGGLVHTHSRWATAWAQAGRDLPVFGTTHADYFYGSIPCTRPMSEQEVKQDYEKNTGLLIVETFRKRQLDAASMPGVLVASHGPFTWGRDAAEAVHNAVVLEECAMMGLHTLVLDPDRQSIPGYLLEKHYKRKHGSGAYYGQ